MIRTEIDSMPTELDEISSVRLFSMEIEEAALEKRELTQLSKEHLEEIQKELAEMRDKFNVDEGAVGKREERYWQGSEAPRGDRAGQRRNRKGRARIRSE